MFTTKAAALQHLGGFGKPSKMPGKAFGLSAHRCKTGTILHEVEGSVCSSCYALKGCYVFSTTKSAHERRYTKLIEALTDTAARSLWLSAAVTALKGEQWFRWHDSGDLQSVEHLHLIADVALLTPDTQHWLPTREVRMLREYLITRELPKNLIVRLSATMIDGEPFKGFPHTSTVHSKGPALGHRCPAPDQDNSCGLCRACWNPEIANVSYTAH